MCDLWILKISIIYFIFNVNIQLAKPTVKGKSYAAAAMKMSTSYIAIQTI